MENANLEMLEFNKVLEILSHYSAFSASKELIMHLKPSVHADVIILKLKQSSESRHLLALRPNFSIGQVSDIRDMVRLAAKGKVLEAMNLVQVKEMLAASRNVRNSLKRLGGEIPELWNIAGGIVDFHDIENEIEKCINVNGEILDTASVKLGSLRYQLQEAREHLNRKLEAILKSRNIQRFIQEGYITERNSRYVIPIKAEFKRDMGGIVHDISNTGNTVFIEPLETVEMGNELRQIDIEVKQEIERILLYLSGIIGDKEFEICTNVEILAELDLNLAKAKYAEHFKAIEPIISYPDNISDKAGILGKERVLHLVDARHPLLRGEPVPLTVELGKDFNILVITGPNAGGKTVSLKTVGLLALMAQAGIPIPVSEGSILPVFKGVFADIGDQQSIEQTLSTFSWHIGNIVSILDKSNGESLVLLDELGISTDPEEGAALARAILLDFLARGTLVVATTHYNELKAFAHVTPGMQNASLNFDPDTLMPTYTLSLGIPGRSNAISVASRLGLPVGVIEQAKTMLRQSSREIELLLSDLLEDKQRYEIGLKELEKDRKQLNNLKVKLKENEARIIEKEHTLLNEVSDTLMREIASLQREIREAEAELRRARKAENIRKAREISLKIQGQIEVNEARVRAISEVDVQKAVAVVNLGDIVRVRNRNIEGMLISIDEKNKMVEIKVGNANVKVGLDEIEGVVASQKEAIRRYPELKKRRTTLIASTMELDLRGKRADAVETILDRFLNDAFLSSLRQVRVIHGYASGTLRQVVRKLLSHHSLVDSYEAGGKDEGGDGVTLVKMKI